LIRTTQVVAKKFSSKYQLSRWLVSRHGMKKRVAILDLGDRYKYCALALGLEIEVSKFNRNGPRTVEDMAIDALAYFESHFVLSGPTLRSSPRKEEMIATEMRLWNLKMQNAHPITPPFEFSRMHVEQKLHSVPPAIKQCMRIIDINRFRQIDPRINMKFLIENVFKMSNDGTPGLPWTPNKVDSLAVLCYKSMSVYNTAFGGDVFGAYTTHSCDNIYPHKLVKLLQKYDKPTVKMVSQHPLIPKAMSHGLRLLYDEMDTRRYFQKLVFTYSDEDVINLTIPQAPSAGIRKGRAETIQIAPGHKQTITPNGTKGDQEWVVKDHFIDMIKSWRETGKMWCDENAYSCCLKPEIFNNTSFDDASRAKTYGKAREFFIQSTMQYVIAMITHKDRHMIERGRVIKIGMHMIGGGAQYFADEMNYTDPNAIFGAGDNRAHDSVVFRSFMELHESQTLLYYDRDRGDYKLLEALVRYALESISVKQVHFFMDYWFMLIGCIPSGALQTSHMGTWVLAFAWYTYCAFMITTNPHMAPELSAALKEHRIRISCMGDNHISRSERKYEHIISEAGFAKFVAEHFKWEITDLQADVPFLSEPDGFGNLKTTGVIFCKRAFIDRDANGFPPHVAKVLPYKKFSDIVVKLAYGNNVRKTNADYVMASIGLAYDTMGTNRVAYDACKTLHDTAWAAGNYRNMGDVMSDYVTTHENTKDMEKICRKLDISFENFKKGFPSIDDLINMHIYDIDYVSITHRFERVNYTNKEF
jgi:hypothetical protein